MSRYEEICRAMEGFNVEQQTLYVVAVIQNLSPIADVILDTERKPVFEESLQAARKIIEGEKPEIDELKPKISEIARPFIVKDGILYEYGVPWDSPDNHFATREEAESILDEAYSALSEKEKHITGIFEAFDHFFNLITGRTQTWSQKGIASFALYVYRGIDDFIEREIFDPQTGIRVTADFEETEGLRELRIIKLIAQENVPARETIRQVENLIEETNRDLKTKIRLVKASGQWAYD